MEKNLVEDYCTYEVAKLLKEKGFDWPCHGSYHIEYPNNKIAWSPKPINDDGQIFMNAPTHQMAMKWLRERCCYIVVNPDPSDETESTMLWWVEIMHKTDYKEFYDFDTYEEAVEAALKYSLENLI